MEHSYCMPVPKETALLEHLEVTPETLNHDHGYTNRELVPNEDETVSNKYFSATAVQKSKRDKRPPRQRKTKRDRFKELQSTTQYQEHTYTKHPMPVTHSVQFKERDLSGEMSIMYEFLLKGIDIEDINYLRISYEALLANDTNGYWLNDTHWVDHCVTDLYSSPPKRRKKGDEVRVHMSGCARTEGYYKVEAHEKAKYKHHQSKSFVNLTSNHVTKMQGNFLFQLI